MLPAGSTRARGLIGPRREAGIDTASSRCAVDERGSAPPVGLLKVLSADVVHLNLLGSQ